MKPVASASLAVWPGNLYIFISIHMSVYIYLIPTSLPTPPFSLPLPSFPSPMKTLIHPSIHPFSLSFPHIPITPQASKAARQVNKQAKFTRQRPKKPQSNPKSKLRLQVQVPYPGPKSLPSSPPPNPKITTACPSSLSPNQSPHSLTHSLTRHPLKKENYPFPSFVFRHKPDKKKKEKINIDFRKQKPRT